MLLQWLRERWWGSEGGSENWSDVLKVEPTGLADRLDVWCERRRVRRKLNETNIFEMDHIW